MNGWKPMPLLLKILSVVLFLWTVMSLMVVVTMPEREIAFAGMLLSGIPATFIVLLLDVFAPLAFLYALWKRLSWGALLGMLYNGIFIANGILATILFRDVFGNGMFAPLIASVIFFSIIYWHRGYFKKQPSAGE